MSDLIEINHLGKTLKTTIYKRITEEEYQDIIERYKEKPSKEEVKVQLLDLFTGKSNINIITRYYFRDLMDKVKIYRCHWSIEDAFKCKELIEHLLGIIETNDKVYPKNVDVVKNIETAIRTGGRTCGKPTQFPYKTIDSILQRYNVNNNYFDFSCGWGCRLLASLVNNVNYYGTDPNHGLTERLEEMKSDYREMFGGDSVVKIYTQGSEEHISELDNTIGLAFSSPPYFGLEDYVVGNQSFNEETSYKEWLNSYFLPTLQNIKRYVINGGYFLINIKDYNGYRLEEHTVKIAEHLGFEFIGKEELKNGTRVYVSSKGTKFDIDSTENIYVFRKRGI